MHIYHTKFITLFLTFLACASGLAQENRPCPNIAVINDNPIESGKYLTRHGIWSAGKVATQTNVDFGSIDFIELKNGFEVEKQATFSATMDGCEADCVERLPICSGDPCPIPPFKEDTEGRKYEPGTIIITLPSKIDLSDRPQYQSEIKSYLDNITMNTSNESTIKRCMCDENIFIYESSIPINEETSIGQANGGYGPHGEGIFYSFNYYLEPDFADNEDNTVSDEFDIDLFQQAISNQKSDIVAFLDSGVDPTLLPPRVLLKNTPTPCFPDDILGWNFIDDNNNILDDRGHGTAVILNYLNALDILGVSHREQVILPVKVLDGCGRGTMYSVICGLYYAKSKGAKIINNSWGLYFNNLQLQEAVMEMNDHNIAISCSAGNSSKNLAENEHFPSGYAQDFFKLKRVGTGIDTTGLEHVFEVGGLCRAVQDASSATEVPIWPESNHREFMFVEAAIRVESLLNTTPNFPTQIECGISGTSYAAPQFTAGLVHFCLNNVGDPINQSTVLQFTQQINSVDEHYSYILDNL